MTRPCIFQSLTPSLNTEHALGVQLQGTLLEFMRVIDRPLAAVKDAGMPTEFGDLLFGKGCSHVLLLMVNSNKRNQWIVSTLWGTFHRGAYPA